MSLQSLTDLSELNRIRARNGTPPIGGAAQPSMASLGGFNWGSLGGGAGTGAAIGSAIAPGVGTLIGAGVGALGSAISAGIKGAEEKKRYEEELKRQEEAQKEAARQRALDRGEQNRQDSMQGIDYLANMRAMAIKNFRAQTYRDGVLKMLQGGM